MRSIPERLLTMETETTLCTVPDTAILFEGGGYRASYTAGFANVLLEHGLAFDFVCGVSAGASHTVDFVSRDHQRIHDSFIILADRKPEAGGVRSFLAGKGYFNADYDYVGCVEDGYMPFDFKAFSENPARVAIQSIEGDTGRTVVFTKDDMATPTDLMNKVRMSSTLPGMMQPLTYEGHVMYDGGIGEGAGIPLHLIEKSGCSRVFVVATRPFGYRKEPPTDFEKRLYRRISKGQEGLYQALLTRSERYNQTLDELRKMEKEGRAYVVRPRTMPVKSTTNDRAKLEDSYARGHAQAEEEWAIWESWLFGPQRRTR